LITFKIYLDGEFKQKIKLLREVETLGRSRSATLRLTDSTISGTHAQIKRSAQGGVTIKDLGSSNGTFVNDVRIDIQVLKVSDRIRIGRIGLKVYGIDPPVTKKKGERPKPLALAMCVS
jgi:pSer/pThr/pTyr-binding forkhead associated (FHA) protein